MENLQFHIPAKKYSGESTVISCRMPKSMLKDIDELAERTGRTRNEVIQMSLEFALEHLCENEDQESEER